MTPRRVSPWRWYSICSMHRHFGVHCAMCQSGRWVFEPWAKVTRWRFYRTHKNVNGQWVQK